MVGSHPLAEMYLWLQAPILSVVVNELNYMSEVSIKLLVRIASCSAPLRRK